ncbi:MAG: filamentous hemagglutinin N-terminal domain-containing protein, partial [Planctomycetes bacterium]|nr:filamentous hemagglutinin N-terminal domain-containing protein [Planctomycetota bacterium]
MRSAPGIMGKIRPWWCGLLACSLLLAIHPAAADPPSGATVVGGDAVVSQPDPNTVLVRQTSQRAILNWRRFSIDVNEYVRFEQPNATSIALNRVTGSEPSTILGRLSANGRVFLLNPNGILFGPSARVDVAGLLATTFDIQDDDFLSGRYTFARDPAQELKSVINRGEIRVSDEGFLFLVGSAVGNEGQLIARLGKVVLGSGERLTLDMSGDRLITFAVDGSVLDTVRGPDGNALDAAVSNSGTIRAEGGEVVLVGRSPRTVFQSVINNSGVIEAKSLVNRGGVIRLEASDPVVNTGAIGAANHLGEVRNAAGDVLNTGTLDVSAIEGGATHGTITLSGERVGVAGNLLALGADGTNGGNILLTSTERTVVATGATLDASGRGNSSGGNIVIWSDLDTIYYADLLARGGDLGGSGGRAEVSGHRNLGFYGGADLAAPGGVVGSLLLDPWSLQIIGGSGGAMDGSLPNALHTTSIDQQVSEYSLEALGAVAVRLEAYGDIFMGAGLFGGGLDLDLSDATSVSIVADSENNGSGDFLMDWDDRLRGPAAGVLAITGARLRIAMLSAFTVDLLATSPVTGTIYDISGLDPNITATNARLRAPFGVGEAGGMDNVELQVTNLAGSGGAGDFRVTNIGALNLATVGGTAGITANGTVSLATSGAITQSPGAWLVANVLVLRAGGPVTLNEVNSVLNLAASVSGAGNGFSLATIANLVVTIVDGVNGVNTNNGAISLTANYDASANAETLTVGNTGAAFDVDAGTSTVALAVRNATNEGALILNAGAAVRGTGGVTYTANNMNLAGTTDAGAGIARLQPYFVGQLINLGGADAAGTLGLTDAELDTITAGQVFIGSGTSGALTVTAGISHPGGWYTLVLASSGAMTQNPGT